MNLFKSIPAFISRIGRQGNEAQGSTGITNQNEYIVIAGNSSSEILKKLGNKCGFNPSSPLVHKSHPDHKKRPPFLNNLIRLTNDISQRRHLLPDLKSRAEVWDALNVILPEYLHYTCLATLKVGISHSDGRFDTISNETLLAGFNRGLTADNEITESRHHAAISALRDAGYIQVTQYSRRTATGEWDGSFVIRQFTEKFFLHLGITEEMLANAQQWKRDQLRGGAANKEANRVIRETKTTPLKISEYFSDAKINELNKALIEEANEKNISSKDLAIQRLKLF